MASKLFSALKLRDIEFRNRIFLSPMDMYSSVDGIPSDWHFVHYGTRAVGGAALLIQEATAVAPEGRITLGDLGIWSDKHAEAFKRITAFVKAQGAVPGVQLAHAGRKASVTIAWLGGDRPLTEQEGAWQTLGASPVAFAPSCPVPREMTPKELDEVVSSLLQRQNVPLLRVMKWLRFIWRTVIYVTNFFRLFPINAATNMAGALSTAPGCLCGWLKP